MADFVAASFAIFGHIFSFNDWCDRKTDAGNPKRKNAPLLSGRITGQGQLGLSACCLAAGLLFSAALPNRVIILSAAFAILSVLYSMYPVSLKTRVFGAILWHFVMGWLVFQFGYAALRPLDAKSHMLGMYFGITYAAVFFGSLIEDHDQDKRFGILTFATRFGSRAAFTASVLCFVLASLYGVYLVMRGYIFPAAGAAIAAASLFFYGYVIPAMGNVRLWRFLPSAYRWVCCCIGGAFIFFNLR